VVVSSLFVIIWWLLVVFFVIVWFFLQFFDAVVWLTWRSFSLWLQQSQAFCSGTRPGISRCVKQSNRPALTDVDVALQTCTIRCHYVCLAA